MTKPSSLYTVKILSEEDFAKLPFKRIQERPGDILGASDPATGIAYVKDTGYNDITKETIAHELDELMAKVSPHEEDGIRYKDMGGALKSFGNTVGDIARPVARSVRNIGGATIRGLNQAGGVFRNFGGRGERPVGIPTPSGAKTATFPGVGQGPVPTASTQSLSPLNVFSAPQVSTGGVPTPAGSNSLNSFGRGLKNFFVSKDDAGQESNSVMDLFKEIGAPVATAALGDIFAPKVEVPDFSGVRDDLMGRITGSGPGASPLRQLGELRLTENLNADITEPPDELFTQGDRISQERLADDLTALERAFKAANPNVNLANNTAFLEARNEIVERERELRAQEKDRVSAEFVNQQKNLRMQEIQTALNLDQAQVAQLIQLAELELGELMLRFNLDYQEAAEFKEMFGNLGQMMYEGGKDVA